MISIVVPVYRVEKYIDICIKSILDQSYKDYELILVDDGSPDSCPQICDAYAQKYSNIHVIHKTNGGLSDARNAGTFAAKGEYITYVDGDDFIDSGYLAALMGLMHRYNADISVTGIQKIYEGEENRWISSNREFSYSGLKALECMLYQNTLDTSACAMLLPIDVARNNLFPVGRYHEDEFTTYKFYSSVNKVAVSTVPRYFYLQRRDSIMHSLGQASLDELDAADNLVKVCELKWPFLVEAANSKKFSDYCQVLLSIPNLKKKNYKTYVRIMEYLSKSKINMLFSRKTRSKNKMAAFLLLGGSKGLIYANNIINKGSEIR